MLSLPTAYWHEITSAIGDRMSQLPGSLRLIIIAGERTLPERLSIWRERVGERTRLINTYGLTESTIISTLCELTRVSPGHEQMNEVSIGRAIRNTEVYVLDRHLQPTPIAVAGEIYIGGLLLARGYFNRPDLTAEKFLPNPFARRKGERLYKTGDLARYMPNSEMEFLGRADQQVKVRGYRVELGEIETKMGQHPAIRDVVVLAQEDVPGEKRLVAYVVPGQEPPPTTSQLRSFLKAEMPDYMIPSAFVMLDSLPVTPNGKVDRRALPSAGTLRPELETLYVAPQTAMEETISKVWQELFHLENVGIHDNFFDLGGHSLLMIQLRTRLEERLGGEISMVSLFKYPTVHSLASFLSGGESLEEPAQPAFEEVEAASKSRRRRRELRQETQRIEI